MALVQAIICYTKSENYYHMKEKKNREQYLHSFVLEKDLHT